jgi:hypothetical protein
MQRYTTLGELETEQGIITRGTRKRRREEAVFFDTNPTVYNDEYIGIG